MAKKITGKQVDTKIDAANAKVDYNIKVLQEEKALLNGIFNIRKRQAKQEEIIGQQIIKTSNTQKVVNKLIKKDFLHAAGTATHAPGRGAYPEPVDRTRTHRVGG